jgi:hypothetical protein
MNINYLPNGTAIAFRDFLFYVETAYYFDINVLVEDGVFLNAGYVSNMDTALIIKI